MREKENIRTTEYTFSECCMRLIRSLVATELLLYGVRLILNSAFEHWVLSQEALRWIQLLVVATVAVNELIPLLGRRYMVKIRVLLEMLLLGWIGWRSWHIREALWTSFHAWFDDYLPYWNAYHDTGFYPYNDGSELGDALAFTVLLVTLCMIILRYVSECRIFLLLPNLAAVGSALLVNVRPDAKSLLVSFAGMLLLYSGGWEAGKAQIRSRIGRQKRVGKRIVWQFAALGASVMVAGILVVLIPICFGGKVDQLMEYGPAFLEFQHRIEDSVMSFAGIGSKSSYDKNKATLDNDKPEYSDETIVTISSDQQPQGNLYLKTFCSADYEDGTWNAPDHSYETEAKDHLIDSSGFAELLQQMTYKKMSRDSVAALLAAEYGQVEGKMQIAYENPRSHSALLPYFWNPSSSDASLQMYKDAVWRKGKEPSVEFTQWLIPASRMLGYDGLYDDTGDKAYEDGEAWYRNYVLTHDRNGTSEVPMIDHYKDRVTYALQDSGQLSGDDSENTCDRVKEALAAWETFLNASYWSDQDTGKYESYTTNLARNEVAREVRNQLFSDTEYNLYLDDLPAGMDPIEYFLRTSKEGYCMHYASAATLILQELGVPARYASGFVVKPGNFRSEGGESDQPFYVAAVKDYCAHAWVEIYMDDIGWVPYEMTPGYMAKSDSFPTDGRQDDQLKQRHEERRQERLQQEASEQPSETIQPGETETQTNTQITQKKETQSGTETGVTRQQNRGKGFGKVLLIICLCIFLAGFVFYGSYRFVVSYRQRLVKELKAKRNRNAVKRINRRIYRGLMKGRPMNTASVTRSGMLGLQMRPLTDAEYAQKLVKAYPSVAEVDWMRYMEIVKKCAFSHEVITDEEAGFCYKIYEKRRK